MRLLPRAVLFDMDGVLVDSEGLYARVYHRLLEEGGHAPDMQDYTTFIGQGWQELAATLEARHAGMDGADFVARWKAACHPTQAGLPDAKPGGAALLDLLDRLGIPAAVATGSQAGVAEAYLHHHDLHHRFVAIVAHEDVTQGKPHPEPFLTAARRLGVAPAGCLVLEDSRNGLRAAAAGGMRAIFVPDLIAPDAEIERLALFVARDLGDVTDWLRSIPAAAASSPPAPG